MRPRNTLRYVALLAATLVAGRALPQTPFALDTTFRMNVQSRAVSSVLPLPDGKVIASGVMRFPGEMSEKTLVRLLPNGMRDETFYNSGLGGGGITPWQDRFYVAGNISVRRVLANGTNDHSFAMSVGTIPYFIASQGGDYHVFPDGRVVMSGAHTLNDPVRGFVGQYQFIWFTNTGYLDTTRTHRKGNGDLSYFQELPDGKFIVSGLATVFDGRPVSRVFRLHADGSVDTTFHTGVNWGEAKAYLPLPDGRVYVGGLFRRSAAPQDTLRLVRLLPDGSLDPAFNIPSFLAGQGLTTPYGATVHGIRPWGDGRLLITGQFKSVNGQSRKGICMIDTTGQLLDAFDACGVGAFTYMGITNAGVIGMMPSSDDMHLYLWGTYMGYDDGTVNDPLQRFVTRLHMGDISTEVVLQEQERDPAFKVHPNPASGWVRVALETPHGAMLVMRDALGREVLRQQVSGHHTTLALDACGSGVYLLEVWSGDARTAVQRLVVE